MTVCTLPKRKCQAPRGRTALLDADGIAGVGEIINPGDVYVNKQSPMNVRDPIHNPNMLPDSFYRPSAQTYKGPDGETPVVDKVLLTSTDDNQFVIKTLVRDVTHNRLSPVGVCRRCLS